MNWREPVEWPPLLVVSLLLASAAAAAPSVSATSEAGADAPPPFTLSLMVSASGVRDQVIFGVDPLGTYAYDPGLDQAQAPRPFGGTWLQAHLEAPAQRMELTRLQTSILPAHERVSSTLVITSSSLTNATMTWNRSQLDVLPERFILELSDGNRVVDMREADSFTIELGRTGAGSATLMLFPLEGSPPTPPQRPWVAPAPDRHSVVIRWEPPKDAGGAPLRGYILYRAYGTDPPTAIARVNLVKEYEDSAADVGMIVSYFLTAASALGESERSLPAVTLGTVPPPALRSFELPDGWQELRLLYVHRGVPEQALATEPVQQGVVEGRPRPSDPRQYELTVKLPSGEEHNAAVYTGALLNITINHTLIAGQKVFIDGGAVAIDIRYQYDPRRCEEPFACWTNGNLTFDHAHPSPHRLLIKVGVTTTEEALRQTFSIPIPARDDQVPTSTPTMPPLRGPSHHFA